MGFYWPGQCVPAAALAQCRGQDPDKIGRGLGIRSFVVSLPFEDAVSMAANAVQDLLDQRAVDVLNIGRLVVATETGTDHAKPIAVHLHGLFNLPARCEAFDVKFACVSGTYALLDAVSFVRRTGQHAVVVATDIARYARTSSAEFTQGAGAVAMLVTPEPGLFVVHTENTGTYTSDEADFFRPVGLDEAVVRGRYSIESYLQGLEAVDQVRLQRTPARLFAEGDSNSLDYLVFHAPYPGLARKALRRVVGREPVSQERLNCLTSGLELSLVPATCLGNLYTGSLFTALGALVAALAQRLSGVNIGLYSFGSGSGAKFFTATGTADPVSAGHCTRSFATISDMTMLTVEDYETIRFEKAIPASMAPNMHNGWRLANIDSSGYRHYQRT